MTVDVSHVSRTESSGEHRLRPSIFFEMSVYIPGVDQDVILKFQNVVFLITVCIGFGGIAGNFRDVCLYNVVKHGGLQRLFYTRRKEWQRDSKH